MGVFLFVFVLVCGGGWGRRRVGYLPSNPKTASGRHTCRDLGIAREKYQCQGSTPHSTDLFCTVLNSSPVPGGGEGGGWWWWVMVS